jgi:hypothetical protein
MTYYKSISSISEAMNGAMLRPHRRRDVRLVPLRPRRVRQGGARTPAALPGENRFDTRVRNAPQRRRRSGLQLPQFLPLRRRMAIFSGGLGGHISGSDKAALLGGGGRIGGGGKDATIRRSPPVARLSRGGRAGAPGTTGRTPPHPTTPDRPSRPRWRRRRRVPSPTSPSSSPPRTGTPPRR